MKIEGNVRGFATGRFKDRYGVNCSIQKSSAAMEDCIWLGVDDANPQIMASQAKQFGIQTNEITGWIPYPIPDEVFLTTRMHLTQKQVADLLPFLQKFVATGEL
jgi:hypothetical protein